MIRITLLLSSVLLLVSLGACKVKKGMTDGESITGLPTVDLWQKIEDQNFDFEWYSARADVQVTFDEMTLGGNADIRIRKDSVIFMRVRKFGLELARVLITPDSLFAINRLQASYFKSSIDSMNSFTQIPFGFNHMQEMIVGNHLTSKQIPVSSSQTNQGYFLRSSDGTMQVDYTLDKEFRVKSSNYTDTLGRSAEMEISDWREVEDLTIPFRRDYFYPGKEEAEYIFFFQLQKMEIDEPKKISFEIPEGYTRL